MISAQTPRFRIHGKSLLKKMPFLSNSLHARNDYFGRLVWGIAATVFWGLRNNFH